MLMDLPWYKADDVSTFDSIGSNARYSLKLNRLPGRSFRGDEVSTQSAFLVQVIKEEEPIKKKQKHLLAAKATSGSSLPVLALFLEC